MTGTGIKHFRGRSSLLWRVRREDNRRVARSLRLPDPDRLLTEREGETYEFAVLHKRTYTDRWKMERGHMRFMKLQTFLARLGDNSLQSGVAWAFKTEGILRKL